MLLQFRSMILGAGATLVLATAALAQICVSDGTSESITFTTPDLPADSGGLTPDTQPTMWEDDVFSDDFMGAATSSSPGSATGTVTNSGGDLFGPRGGDQNGGLEGDCIEVKMCWDYEHYVPAISLPVEHPIHGLIWMTIDAHFETRKICTDPPEVVCPSGSGGCP